MKLDHLLIAGGAVGVTLFLFLAAFVANGYGQLHTTGTYVPPAELVEIIKLVLGASLTVLTLGSMPVTRKLLGVKSKEDEEEEDRNQRIRLLREYNDDEARDCQ